MKTLTIDRKRWLCGEGSENSELYRPKDRKMCCLGFFARQICGAKVEDIKGKDGPGDTTFEWPEWLLQDRITTDKCYRLMETNDVEILTTKERESKVKKMFAKKDIKTVFVGKYK